MAFSGLPRRRSLVTPGAFVSRQSGLTGRGGEQRDDGLDVVGQLGRTPQARFHPSHQARHAIGARLAQPDRQFAQGRFGVTPTQSGRHRSRDVPVMAPGQRTGLEAVVLGHSRQDDARLTAE